MKKSIALVAMCATALSPVLSTAAYADTVLGTIEADAADSDTLADMQDQCDDLAAGYDTNNGDVWEGNVVPGAVTLKSGPTEVEGTRVIDETTRAPLGDYVPESTYIDGDPYRTGGSVNMFGDQYSKSGYYPDSTYEFNADFASTWSHAFKCDITQQVFHAAYTEQVPAMGAYVVNGDFGESEEGEVRGNCEAFTNQGFPLETRPDWWGVDLFRGGNPNNPHCRFEGTQATTIEHEEKLDAPVSRYLLDGVPVDQDQTDVGIRALEDHGGPIGSTGTRFQGKVVVCISPSKTSKGTLDSGWRLQNGYEGTKCTTEWFKMAPIKEGSTTSQGTYISVPNYYPL